MTRGCRPGQAGKEVEVGCRAGLEGEGQHRDEQDRGEGGQALAEVAAHGWRVARAVGGRKGIGPLSTQDRGAEVRDIKGLAAGDRGVLSGLEMDCLDR